jgi:hypothetical protein
MSSLVVAVPKYRHHTASGRAPVQNKGRRQYSGKWNIADSKER